MSKQEGAAGETFVMRWPIVRKDVAIKDLTAEARGDLVEALRLIRRVPTSQPLFTVSHGAKPELRAELSVRGAA
ncbi:hypothetical protein PBI_ANDREW_60 [Arthrobacter phage Andrew]|uniref:Uncharacterized protein n=1 Tax=Arthrobacter phage Andrew TaxID=2419946 RepID=A0A3G2KCY3_9CAUD|nr:hypothetical protein HOU53_gp60 [Arthrobacter phage Andrew]AYN56874.1 hypothetical protein PBI_ANDREW_60 [Arthrobacter phage Andrew]